MKRYILLLFILNAIVVGCVDNIKEGNLQQTDDVTISALFEAPTPDVKSKASEILSVEGKEIEFIFEPLGERPLEGIATKASLVYDHNSLITSNGNSIKVSSFQIEGASATPFITNKTASYNDLSYQWILDQKQEWPENAILEFFGCSPANALDFGTITRNASGSSFSYSHTVPDVASNQRDMLFGYYKGEGDKGRADMIFTHPLTAVEFNFGDIPEDVRIISLTIKNIAKSGNLSAMFSNPDGSEPSYSWSITSSGNVSHDFGSTSPSSAVTIPFVLIPQTLGNSTTLELGINYLGENLTLTKSLNSEKWESGKVSIYKLSYNITTGITISSDYTITNTGKAAQYVRAAIVGNWKDASGNIVAPWTTAKGSFSGLPGANWILSTDGFYYYKYPLKQNASPTKLFASFSAPATPAGASNLELTVMVQGVIWDSLMEGLDASWPTHPDGMEANFN